MKNKTCISCNQNLSIKMFYKAIRQKDGYDYYCKECRKSKTLISHRGGKNKPQCTFEGCETPNYAGNLCKMHYERNRRTGTPNLINYGREQYERASYETMRKNHLKRTFKLTTEEYEEMSKNGCEICGKEGLKHKKLHVDHDHKCCPTKKYPNGHTMYFKTCGECIRGILCDRCNGNVGLYEKGMLRNDYPDREKIIIYVAKYDKVISDRIDSYDKKQRNRQG